MMPPVFPRVANGYTGSPLLHLEAGDMSEKAKQAVAIFGKQIGSSDGHGEWIAVDQKRINLFADATLDHQFIHIDPEKSAKLSPYKVTIAHGFLTLSLIPHLTSSIAARDAR